MQVLAFKNITQSMKSFSILMVKSCGPYKYTYYIHVSVAISGFLEWCANKNGDQIVSLKRKVTLVLSANCPIYRIARICLPNGLYVKYTCVKGERQNEKKISLPYLCTLWSELPLFDSFIIVISDLVSWAHNDGSDEHPFMRSLARAFAIRIN